MKFRGTFKLVTLLTVFLVSAVGVAYSDSETANLGVSATVVDNVRITAVANVSFGSYDPTSSTDTDAAGAVSLRATKSMTYSMYISGDRTLSLDDNDLGYELYQNPDRSTAWGNDLAGSTDFTSASNEVFEHGIYGRIPALTDVPAGSYSDTATVNIEW